MRKLSTILLMITMTIGLDWWSMAIAGDFRCGTKLISRGDLKPRVLAECGDPTHIEVWHEERVYDVFAPYYFSDENTREYRGYRRPVYVRELVTIERWTYNLGNHKLIRYLTFENGRLALITTGEHGF